MVMFDNSPDVTIDRILADAAGHRRCGTNVSDVDALREALTEALDEANSAESARSKEAEALEERVGELEAEANCGISDRDRREGGKCDGDDCTACRLVWAAMEKDCGASDERRVSGLCGASHLGVDRCCECAAHLLKIETDGLAEDQDAEIARLTSERDAATPGKSADIISGLRSDLAIARARHDCGRTDRESGTPCPNDDPQYGGCDACILAGAARRFSQEADAKIAGGIESMRAENERMRDALQDMTNERNDALAKLEAKPVRPVARAKVNPVKAHEGRSLFDLLAKPAQEPAVKVKASRVKGRNVKKYPATVKP